MDRKGAIELINLDKSFGDNHVVNNISLSLNAGEFTSFLGPSGCGKTTILRMIAGFETLDGGDIRIDGNSIIHLPPERRKVHTVFQHYALFPHMNVYDNVAYGLRAAGCKRSEIRQAVEQALAMVQLEGFEHRMPHQMSGGQKQRVSIARAIVNRPSVLLLDEPLTALDMKLRKEMRYKLRELQQQLGITFLYVTHDQEEAMIMSDRIVVLSNGNIEQEGTPEEIYTTPQTAFVSDFIGDTNAFEGVAQTVAGNRIGVLCESGHFPATGSNIDVNEFINVSIRPHQMQWSETPIEDFAIRGVVTDYIFTGSFVAAVLELINGRTIRISRLAGEGLPEKGQQVYLYWAPEDAIVMKNSGGNLHQVIENMDLGAWIKQ